MKVAVVGTGYIGLVSGICFAETGNDVICADIDQRKVDMLSCGQIPIFEPGLEILFKRNLKEGRLSFTIQLEDAEEKIETWRQDYNHFKPHSPLNNMTPIEYIKSRLITTSNSV